MKALILLILLVSAAAFARASDTRPIILISYFEPYLLKKDGSYKLTPFNNSERIATALKQNFEASTINLQTCRLPTVFDKAYAHLESCLRNLPERPVLVLSLGEFGCELKLETMMRNQDKTIVPDNEFNERDKTTIIPEGASAIGLKLPLPQMYCSLPQKDRGEIIVSNDAGGFVCNNTAYQMSYYYPELHYGFIHVPQYDCRKLEIRNEIVVRRLEQMIKAGVSALTTQDFIPSIRRLPTKKVELETLRSEYEKKDRCLHEYYKRSKAEDQKGRFWSFLD